MSSINNQNLISLANAVSVDAYELSKNSTCLDLLDESDKIGFVDAIKEFDLLFSDLTGNTNTDTRGDLTLADRLNLLSVNISAAADRLSDYPLSSERFNEIGFRRMITETKEIGLFFGRCKNLLTDLNTKN